MDSPQIRSLLELEDYSRAAERHDALVARGWTRMEAHFARLKGASAALGAPLTVVILPLPIVYDRDLRQRLGKRWHVDAAAIDAERPNRKLAELLDRLEIPCVDLGPALRDHPLQGKLHLPGDLHFSAAGHAAAADALAARL
jgi:lysophospholipase L1-like esterase